MYWIDISWSYNLKGKVERHLLNVFLHTFCAYISFELIWILTYQSACTKYLLFSQNSALLFRRNCLSFHSGTNTALKEAFIDFSGFTLRLLPPPIFYKIAAFYFVVDCTYGKFFHDSHSLAETTNWFRYVVIEIPYIIQLIKILISW